MYQMLLETKLTKKVPGMVLDVHSNKLLFFVVPYQNRSLLCRCIRRCVTAPARWR